MKKFLYLFLALLVPGALFVFLKYGASNKFDIPVLPSTDSPLHSDCQGKIQGSYIIPDSVWSWIPEKHKPAHVIVFGVPGLNPAAVAAAVSDEIGNNVVFTMGETLSADSTTQARWKSCVFLLSSPKQSVLVDTLGQIRGHYDLRGLEEVDRLRVELKILLEAN